MYEIVKVIYYPCPCNQVLGIRQTQEKFSFPQVKSMKLLKRIDS